MDESRHSEADAATNVGLNSNGVFTIRFKKNRLIVLKGNADLLKICARLCIAVIDGTQADEVL